MWDLPTAVDFSNWHERIKGKIPGYSGIYKKIWGGPAGIKTRVGSVGSGPEIMRWSQHCNLCRDLCRCPSYAGNDLFDSIRFFSFFPQELFLKPERSRGSGLLTRTLTGLPEISGTAGKAGIRRPGDLFVVPGGRPDYPHNRPPVWRGEGDTLIRARIEPG